MRRVALEEAFWCDGPATPGSFTALRVAYGVDVRVLSLTSRGAQMRPDADVAVADARRAGKAVRFLDTAPLARADLARVAHGNAERLLGRKDRTEQPRGH